MNEKNQLQAFALFLFLFVVMSVSTATFAAVTVTPTVAGYARDSVSGGYLNNRAGQGQALFDAASKSYGSTGSFNVGGKAMTAPTKIPLKATAGTIAKNAMRLNPWLLGGSLALPWLIEHGMEWMGDSGWENVQPGTYANSQSCVDAAGDPAGVNSGCNTKVQQYPAAVWWRAGQSYEIPAGCILLTQASWNFTANAYDCSGAASPSIRSPATDADWDNLPDPIDTVGPELPTADYMPQGAPVDAPTYDFAPYSAPTGEPYKKPDGSTVQPMVTVSPNITNITYNTYNTTTHNSAGQPVVDAPPSDENADEIKDPCDTNPDRIGCSTLGEVPDSDLGTEEKSIALITPVDVGGVGQCPAPLAVNFMGTALTFSYDLPCQAAGMLKPLILALAWLSAGIIFIGGVRQ